MRRNFVKIDGKMFKQSNYVTGVTTDK